MSIQQKSTNILNFKDSKCIPTHNTPDPLIYHKYSDQSGQNDTDIYVWYSDGMKFIKTGMVSVGCRDRFKIRWRRTALRVEP